jgi:hypothetical protein
MSVRGLLPGDYGLEHIFASNDPDGLSSTSTASMMAISNVAW